VSDRERVSERKRVSDREKESERERERNLRIKKCRRLCPERIFRQFSGTI
jgi:hypothetical protein